MCVYFSVMFMFQYSTKDSKDRLKFLSNLKVLSEAAIQRCSQGKQHNSPGTIATQNNCPPNNSTSHNFPRTIAPRQLTGQFPPPQTIAPQMDNCHLGQLAPGQFPLDNSHRTIPTQENCPQITAPGQFSPRIIDLQGRRHLDISHLGLLRLG